MTITRELGPELTDWIIQPTRFGYHCEQLACDSGIVLHEYDLDALLAKLSKIKTDSELVYQINVWLDSDGADFQAVQL